MLAISMESRGYAFCCEIALSVNHRQILDWWPQTEMDQWHKSTYKLKFYVDEILSK